MRNDEVKNSKKYKDVRAYLDQSRERAEKWKREYGTMEGFHEAEHRFMREVERIMRAR